MSLAQNIYRLPVSGRVIYVRPITGNEDMLLAEASGGDAELALTLANRLACAVKDAELDWSAMTVTDLDAFILFLRRMQLGDEVRTEVSCTGLNCGQPVDVSFCLARYLDHHAPGNPASACRGWSVESHQNPGWYRMSPLKRDVEPRTGTIAFRLPTSADLLAIAGDPMAENELARRCLQPANAPVPLRRRAEAAMETMAPCLSCELQAVCPECGTEMTLYFESRRYCLRELRDRAKAVYADVDLLARRYHWSENEILSLPHDRRARYAELARESQFN